VRPLAKPATLLVLLFLPLAASAQSARVDDYRKQAQAREQRGDWLEACRYYDEALRRDRTRTEFREGYQRCLRQFHLQRRHRDPGYHDIVSRLTTSQALDVYEEVLLLLSAAYVDRNKTDLNALFQQGKQEVRSALNDESFRRDYFPGVQAETLKPLTLRLQERDGGKLTTPLEARNKVLDLSRSLEQYAPRSRPDLVPALILEFACGACNALDEYTLFLTPGHYSDVQAVLRGKTVGVGVDPLLVEQRVMIRRVYPKSPAAEMGLAAGDRIVRIDGQLVDNLPIEFVMDRLRGEAGSVVELEVLCRGRMDSQLVKMVRRAVVPPSVEYGLVGESDTEAIGYLRIHNF